MRHIEKSLPRRSYKDCVSSTPSQKHGMYTARLSVVRKDQVISKPVPNMPQAFAFGGVKPCLKHRFATQESTQSAKSVTWGLDKVEVRFYRLPTPSPRELDLDLLGFYGGLSVYGWT